MNDENDDYYREEGYWRIPSVYSALLRENIAPCPFCGGKAQTVELDDGFYGIGCADGWCIGAGTKHERYISEEHAIVAWNKREVDAYAKYAAEIRELIGGEGA